MRIVREYVFEVSSYAISDGFPSTKVNMLVDRNCRAWLADFGLPTTTSDTTSLYSFRQGGNMPMDESRAF